AHLLREVGSHHVYVVCEVLPCARHTRDLRLAAKLALGPDFAGHARHFCGERIQLVDHRVDRVLQVENFALRVHVDLGGQVAARHRSRDFGNVADLCCEVPCHRVDRVGQVLPRASHARDVRLATETTLTAYFARHARHFTGEGVQLVDHRVDRLFQEQDL